MKGIEKGLSVYKHKFFYGLFVIIFPVFYCSQINTLSYNKLPFLLSYIRFFFFMSVMAFWISFLVRRLYYPYENEKLKSQSHLARWYYVLVFFTTLLAKILFSIQPHLSLLENLEIIHVSLFDNYPIYLIIVMLFAYWLKTNPHRNMYLSQLKAETYLDLFSLYDYLIKNDKENHRIDEQNFRLFDIVFIHVKSKEATIYLRDGTKIPCVHIVEILKEMNLMHWLVKISQNCYVNVMHIAYPNYTDGKRLILQSETFLTMSNSKMTKREVNKLCQFGSFIGDKNIKRVISNKSDLDYRGEWDAFVKLN